MSSQRCAKIGEGKKVPMGGRGSLVSPKGYISDRETCGIKSNMSSMVQPVNLIEKKMESEKKKVKEEERRCVIGLETRKRSIREWTTTRGSLGEKKIPGRWERQS